MTHKSENIGESIAALVEMSTVRNFDILYDQFQHAMYGLVQKRIVHLKPDHKLGGKGLEVRVRLILEDMGLTVCDGREKNLEDLVVPVPDFAKPSIPLVVEVKSGRKQLGPAREALRELDDWVFELSGEAKIRKNVYEKVDPNRTYFSPGALQPRPSHPNPHKGVLVYNGPVDQPFEERPSQILGPNEKEMAENRSFCVISLPCLLSWLGACKKSQEAVREFWDRVLVCHGELDMPVS